MLGIQHAQMAMLSDPATWVILNGTNYDECLRTGMLISASST
jgi:hypothetical protein